MSSLGSLSHSYSEMARLAEALTDAVATLFRAYEDGACGDHDRRTASRLIPIVRALRRQLHEPHQHVDTEDPILPSHYVGEIREARRGELSYFLQDLDDLASQLEHWDARVSDAAVGTLQLMTRTASDEAASLYRRLRRH